MDRGFESLASLRSVQHGLTRIWILKSASICAIRGFNSDFRFTVSYSFAGSAFQTLRSSKYPSLPATPSSIRDFVAWPMPGDLR